jgi:hypothetical protein
MFDYPDQVLDPEEFAEFDSDRDQAALVMGPFFAEFFGTGAKGGNRNGDPHDQGMMSIHQRGKKPAGVAQETFGPGYGSSFFDKVRKFHFEISRLRIQLPLHLIEDRGNGFDIDGASIFVQDLNEPAHVGPFKLMGEVDIHIHPTHGMLDLVPLVENGYGVFDIFDPHLIDFDAAKIRTVLNIDHFGDLR